MDLRSHAACIVTVILSVISFCHTQAQTGIDLLENGGFEYATTGLSDGNNIGVVPTGWTVTAGEANWQQGASTGGGVTLQPYNGPYSGGTASTAYNNESDIVGNHCFDGTNNNAAGDTILIQTFTLTHTGTNIVGSFALGIREGGPQAGTAANAANTSRIDILNGANVSVLTVYGDTLSTTNGWEVNPFSVSNLPAGTYTFQVTLTDLQNIDAIALVPEPSTWLVVMGGMGVLTLIQVVRHRVAASVRC